eukprot:TRINITY_DN4452_c0_g1_i11.p1 TRINITY_DN4452_c0_g1~~TRINITY_DN4452_c0_g1_i11.p1  ORF type:complete len:129 (-),score=19.96 TRINITY_DN4452_c0_g1_i11:116-502(-)
MNFTMFYNTIPTKLLTVSNSLFLYFPSILFCPLTKISSIEYSVTRCNDQLAIEKLLISDSLFRSQNIKTRATYVDLVQKARENGADVLIFSSLHVSGSQLDQLSGIAAILRFPIQEQETSGDDEEYSI